MFLLFCFAVILAGAVLAGGSLARLGKLRLRQMWLVGAAIGLQLLVTTVLARRAAGAVDDGLHVVSYLLAAVFLWRNRRVPGLLVLGAGAALNGVAITANGGELPASAAALRRAGIHERPGDFANSGALAHPHLAWLGDIVATPAWLPFRNVISIGDLLVLVGAAWLVWATCGTRWHRPCVDRAAVASPQAIAEAESG